jgi:hypothetical protein
MDVLDLPDGCVEGFISVQLPEAVLYVQVSSNQWVLFSPPKTTKRPRALSNAIAQPDLPGGPLSETFVHIPGALWLMSSDIPCAVICVPEKTP